MGRARLGLCWALLWALPGPVVAGPDHWSLPVPEQGEAPAAYPAMARSLDPADCGGCHPRRHSQWRDSVHARAFSPGLAGQLPAFSPGQQRACIACHAPRTEQIERWRTEGRQALGGLHGVDCAGCHVREHRRFGPRAVPDTPHGPVKGRAIFRQSRFCAKCHQFTEEQRAVNGKPLENTYAEWQDSRYAREGVTCQDCHMPDGAHDFQGIHSPAMTRRGLDLTVRRTGDGVTLRATNAGAGHHLPTYATPRIRLLLRAAGGATARHVIGRQLRWTETDGLEERADTRLAAGESVTLRLDLGPEETATATVRVDPGADYAHRLFPLLRERLADDLAPADQRLLERARKRTAERAYTLARFRCPPAEGGAATACQHNRD